VSVKQEKPEGPTAPGKPVRRTSRPTADKREKAFPRLRIPIAEGLVLGPGKVELLEAIDRTGSISAGGREMGMSYRRAWLLVDALNRMFARPLVLTSAGGAKGGGAEVTEEGRAVAAAYRRAEQRANEVVKEEMAALPLKARLK